MFKKIFSFFAVVTILFSIGTQSVFAAGIITDNATAKMLDPDLGLVNFKPDNGDPVKINSNGITGQAWGDSIGWIQFDGTNHETTVSCKSDGTGVVGGYAWGENAGYINMAPDTGGLTIDRDGLLDGYIWTENYGWMHFDKSQCPEGDGCVQTEFECPTGGSREQSTSCKITASDDRITIPKSAVVLSWKLNGVDSITINGTEYDSNDSVTVYPSRTTTYTGIITDDDGVERTCSKTIVVEEVEQACPVFSEYYRLGDRGGQISKVQEFLNGYMNERLAVDGIYGFRTTAAVHRFQSRHFDDIIKPWSPPLSLKTTGRWYKTTAATANIIIGCPETEVYLEDPKENHSFKDTMQRLFNIFISVFN